MSNFFYDVEPEEIKRMLRKAEMRDVVKWFARAMEQRLKENDHKGGWERCTDEYLFRRLVEEVGELSIAIHDTSSEREELVLKEAADVANFTMMIVDNATANIHSKLFNYREDT